KKLQLLAELLEDLNNEALSPSGRFSIYKTDGWEKKYLNARLSDPLYKTRPFNEGPAAALAEIERQTYLELFKLLSQSLLPENLWVKTDKLGTTSLGVRLNENTWARLGLYPQSWHFHVFKSSPSQRGQIPSMISPIGQRSLRIWPNQKSELFRADGEIAKELENLESLNVTRFCELLQAEARSTPTLTQRSLKDL
ncbi:MAG: hypothetical protein KDD22_06555, partial [Bdellovibrionales bacterium]|nr:hypothetical protein [Bdellovibrionales bacterium]